MNTLCLYKFYFKDSFQGILSHPFLRKKYIRIILSLGFIFLYFFYFYINVKQVNIVKNIADSTTLNQLMIAKRQTLSSLYNLTGLLAGLIFLLLESGVHLNEKSLYFTKALPFSKKDIINSERLFYLTLALILFELYVFIIIPMLVLITTRLITAMIIVISAHFFFLGIFQMLRFIYSCLHHRWGRRIYRLILIIVFYFHFVDIRYKIDSYIANKPINLLAIMMISMIVGIALFLMSWSMQKDLNLYMRSEYKFIPACSHSVYLLALIRTRFFKIVCILVAVLSFYCHFVIKDNEGLNFILPFLSLIFLYYGNTTLSLRRMFTHYRIKPLYELSWLTLFICIAGIPSLYVGIMTHHNVQVFLYGFNLSLSALILGILLPKRISNMNELITSIVIILLMMIYLLANTYVLCAILMILWIIAYYTLKEATQ